MTKLHINDGGVWKAVDAANADTLESKTKAEVLQEALVLTGNASVGTPNILINTDVLHAVNQRAFNGNWGALTAGDYGYDRWLKVDTTNKGQIVESGNFVADTIYTLGYNVGSVRTYTQITTPATGHWLVKVPFAADKMDLYIGTVERPWVPEKSALVRSSCQYYHLRTSNIRARSESKDNYMPMYFPVTMREVPTVNVVRVIGTNIPLDAENSSIEGFTLHYNTATAYDVQYHYIADAELTLGDL